MSIEQELAEYIEELDDRLAVKSEIIDDTCQKWGQCQEELTAAEEQLAEMWEALLPEFRQQLKASQQMWPEHTHIWEYVIGMIDKALSAAPKRGRALWARKLSLSKIGDGILEIRLGLGELEFRTDLDLGKGASFTVTVKEAEPPTGPIDCPMCGVAGGDELGPCPKCKGAGFVDGDE